MDGGRLHIISLLSLFLLSVVWMPANANAEPFHWEAVSGTWEDYILDDGNKVLQQNINYDRQKENAPTPYLMYRTLRLNPKKHHYLGTDYAEFQFQTQSLYADKAELAIFFGGRNSKELYFVVFAIQAGGIHGVSLWQSREENLKLEEKAFGNFISTQLSQGAIQVAGNQVHKVIIERKKREMLVKLDGQQVLLFKGNKEHPYIFYDQDFFAIGGRGHRFWLDNILLSKKNKILLYDDFSAKTTKRYRLIIKDVTSHDQSYPTSPR